MGKSPGSEENTKKSKEEKKNTNQSEDGKSNSGTEKLSENASSGRTAKKVKLSGDGKTKQSLQTGTGNNSAPSISRETKSEKNTTSKRLSENQTLETLGESSAVATTSGSLSSFFKPILMFVRSETFLTLAKRVWLTLVCEVIVSFISKVSKHYFKTKRTNQSEDSEVTSVKTAPVFVLANGESGMINKGSPAPGPHTPTQVQGVSVEEFIRQLSLAARKTSSPGRDLGSSVNNDDSLKSVPRSDKGNGNEDKIRKVLHPNDQKQGEASDFSKKVSSLPTDRHEKSLKEKSTPVVVSKPDNVNSERSISVSFISDLDKASKEIMSKHEVQKNGDPKLHLAGEGKQITGKSSQPNNEHTNKENDLKEVSVEENKPSEGSEAKMLNGKSPQQNNEQTNTGNDFEDEAPEESKLPKSSGSKKVTFKSSQPNNEQTNKRKAKEFEDEAPEENKLPKASESKKVTVKSSQTNNEGTNKGNDFEDEAPEENKLPKASESKNLTGKSSQPNNEQTNKGNDFEKETGEENKLPKASESKKVTGKSSQPNNDHTNKENDFEKETVEVNKLPKASESKKVTGKSSQTNNEQTNKGNDFEKETVEVNKLPKASESKKETGKSSQPNNEQTNKGNDFESESKKVIGKSSQPNNEQTNKRKAKEFEDEAPEENKLPKASEIKKVTGKSSQRNRGPEQQTQEEEGNKIDKTQQLNNEPSNKGIDSEKGTVEQNKLSEASESNIVTGKSYPTNNGQTKKENELGEGTVEDNKLPKATEGKPQTIKRSLSNNEQTKGNDLKNKGETLEKNKSPEASEVKEETGETSQPIHREKPQTQEGDKDIEETHTSPRMLKNKADTGNKNTDESLLLNGENPITSENSFKKEKGGAMEENNDLSKPDKLKLSADKNEESKSKNEIKPKENDGFISKKEKKRLAAKKKILTGKFRNQHDKWNDDPMKTDDTPEELERLETFTAGQHSKTSNSYPK